MRSVSVAEARNQLTELLRAVEQGETLAVTRRGRPVAVWLAAPAYERLQAAAGQAADFAAWAQGWRSRLPAGFEGISAEELARWEESA